MYVCMYVRISFLLLYFCLIFLIDLLNLITNTNLWSVSKMPVHKTISVISEDFWKEMLKIAKREGKPLSTIIMDKLKEYRRVHGEGNPVYVLDKFIEDPDFKAVPATMEKKEKWVKFCQNTTDETLKDLEYQGMMIQIIAGAYAKLKKGDERKKTFFANLHQMEIFR